MNTIFYDKPWFDRDISHLYDQLKTKDIHLIVGINRGGCLPAVCLSHALKLPATMIDWSTRDGANVHPRSLYGYFEEISGKYKNVLIVDDLVDSGTSMKKVLQTAQLFCNVGVATLLHNTDVNLDVAHYWGSSYSRRTEPRYFDFWWEMYGIQNV